MQARRQPEQRSEGLLEGLLELLGGLLELLGGLLELLEALLQASWRGGLAEWWYWKIARPIRHAGLARIANCDDESPDDNLSSSHEKDIAQKRENGWWLDRGRWEDAEPVPGRRWKAIAPRVDAARDPEAVL